MSQRLKRLNRRAFLASAAAGSVFHAIGAGAGADAQKAAGPTPRGKHKEPYRGIFIIMQTPFHDTLEIDEASLRRETDFLVRCGVHGMVWPAGAGETHSLSHDERLKYAEVIVQEAKGRVPVVIGVHGPNKFEAAEYARHAEKIGADAILAMGQTDRASDQGILTEYFTAIASAAKLPFIIQTTTSALTVDYLIDLAKKLPTLRYVKEELDPPGRIDRYVREAKGILTPMTGGGARNLLNEMARGSWGTMPGAGFADIQAQIWDWYDAGRKKEARDLFAKMLMMAVLEMHTGFVVQKEILRRRGVFRTVHMRRTREFTMKQGDLQELDAIFEVLRPSFRV